MGEKAALVIGAGSGTGGAIAKRFAREGFVACVVRRTADKLPALVGEIEAAGGRARAFGCDARKEEEMVALVDEIERDVGPIEVAVFNVGANVPASILEETARKYFKIWEMACFGGFLMGREVARRMVPRGRGTILYTGATASVRGREHFAAFAGAKHALRALAQSMARELGPKNIHVAHLVIDAGVDTAFVRERIRQRSGAEALGRLEPDQLMNPSSIAEAYWQLYRQPRDAWTFELDLRPWMESW